MLIGSIVVGFIGLMCLPVAVLSSMGSMEVEPPEIDKSLFNESAIIAGLDSEQQAKNNRNPKQRSGNRGRYDRRRSSLSDHKGAADNPV